MSAPLTRKPSPVAYHCHRYGHYELSSPSSSSQSYTQPECKLTVQSPSRRPLASPDIVETRLSPEINKILLSNAIILQIMQHKQPTTVYF